MAAEEEEYTAAAAEDTAEEDIEYADEEEDELLSDEEISEEEADSAIAYSEDEEGSSLEQDSYTESDSSYMEGAEMEEDSPIYEASSPAQPAAKKWIPVKKIPTSPWKFTGKFSGKSSGESADQWINAVYITRAGDTLESVSLKIYGSPSQAMDLKKWNPHFKNKEPKVGDKIYYNSPERPQDSSKFLTFYEDKNQNPSSYDIESGENIRTVSEKLLGHPDSWKEVWATNFNLESKGKINEKITVLYWTGQEEAAPEAEPASNPMADEPMAEEAPSLASTEDDLDPSLDDSLEDEEGGALIGGLGETGADTLKPPAAAADGSGMMAKIKTGGFGFKVALIGLIVSALGLLLAKAIRKRKASPDFDFTQTNIDIDNIEE